MKLKLLIASLFVVAGFTGCLGEKKVSDEEASKLPICIETSDNMYTMSQSSIGEIAPIFKQISGNDGYNMYPIKEGKQLIFKFRNETIMLDTRYQELEKGACMEVIHTIIKDAQGNKVVEAHSSNANDYRTLVKVAEFIFKF